MKINNAMPSWLKTLGKAGLPENIFQYSMHAGVKGSTPNTRVFE
jgi:hypothetical protein